jgi:hypothetical protein
MATFDSTKTQLAKLLDEIAREFDEEMGRVPRVCVSPNE